MKIKYLNLKQLDRIEYLLLKKQINYNFTIIQALVPIAILYGLYFILALVFYDIFDNTNLIDSIGSVKTIIKYSLAIFLIIDIVTFGIYLIKKKKLNKRFFKQ